MSLKKNRARHTFIFLLLLVFIASMVILHSKYAWKTFTSNRAKFSFKYPPTWSITQCGDEYIKGWDRIEYIEFSKTCPSVNITKVESFGDITVR